MPLVKIESFESQEITRSYDVSERQIKVTIVGTEDTQVAESEFYAWLGSTIVSATNGLVQTNVKHIGGGVHEATAVYRESAPEVVKTIRYRTTGQTARIIQGYGTQYSAELNPAFNSNQPIGSGNQPYRPGPNFNGLIGVTRDGVEGVDIPVPSFSFSIDYRFSSMDQAYLNLVHRLTGCVNTEPYLGFATGELMFAGLEGEIGEGVGGAIILSASPVSFLFEAIPNATNLTVGPFVIPFKYGWDYLWPRTIEVATGSTVIRQTKSVHVDRVLRWANLQQLGV